MALINLWVENGREKLCLCGEWVRSWSVALPPLSAAGGGFGAFFLILWAFRTQGWIPDPEEPSVVPAPVSEHPELFFSRSRAVVCPGA